MEHISTVTSPLLQGFVDQAALAGTLPTGNVVIGMRAAGIDIPHVRSLAAWCEVLDLDWDKELAGLMANPQGGRGIGLCILVRDDEAGGVAAVLSCIGEFARLAGFTPRPAAEMRKVVEELGTPASPWCPGCGRSREACDDNCPGCGKPQQASS
mgnify:CR=1 FL=1